jgi:hypothetical protein
MIALLDIVQDFSTWSDIHLNSGKCNITAYIQTLQILRKKRYRDDALPAILANVSMRGGPMGTLTRDEPMSRGYLGTTLTASLCPDAHLFWTKT